MLGLDTDNGGEFINYELLRYCEREKISFTRARAYKKNDQSHVEEKNGSVVRRLIGYDRYEGLDAWKSLSALYRVLRLYVNFFQPSMKLLAKDRNGSHVTKRYDKAQTPYQRVISSNVVTDPAKESLRRTFEQLDPVCLLEEIQHQQNQFWQHAWKINAPLELVNDKSHAETVDMTPMSIPSRIYRRTKKPSAPHTWRTRKDPFEDVWVQVCLLLKIDPGRTAKEIFQELQSRHPGRFDNGQLRTLQRRIKEWRREALYSDEVIREEFQSKLLSDTMAPIG